MGTCSLPCLSLVSECCSTVHRQPLSDSAAVKAILTSVSLSARSKRFQQLSISIAIEAAWPACIGQEASHALASTTNIYSCGCDSILYYDIRLLHVKVKLTTSIRSLSRYPISLILIHRPCVSSKLLYVRSQTARSNFGGTPFFISVLSLTAARSFTRFSQDAVIAVCSLQRGRAPPSAAGHCTAQVTSSEQLAHGAEPDLNWNDVCHSDRTAFMAWVDPSCRHGIRVSSKYHRQISIALRRVSTLWLSTAHFILKERFVFAQNMNV